MHPPCLTERLKKQTRVCSASPQELYCLRGLHYFTVTFRYITADILSSSSTHLKELSCRFKYSKAARLAKI